jgi:hypothetical protein
MMLVPFYIPGSVNPRIFINAGALKKLTEELKEAHIGTRPSIDDEIIKDLERLGRPRRETHDLAILSTSLGRLLVVAFDGGPSSLGYVGQIDFARLATPHRPATLHPIGLASPVDGAREPHAQIDTHAGFYSSRDDLLARRVVEVGKKSKRAEGKGNNWRNDALEEPRSKQNCAVATQLFFSGGGISVLQRNIFT